MNNMEYWAARALRREKEAYLRGAGLSLKMMYDYDNAAKQIRRQIDSFYSRYAKKYGLKYEDAVRLLNRREFQEWRASLEEYVARIARTADPQTKLLLTAHLDALSANSSITRLEALYGQIELIMNDLYDVGVSRMKAEFGDMFVEGYYKKNFDIQARAEFFREIAKIDFKTVEQVISYPWSGAMFSERYWQMKNQLVFNIREIITQGVIQGKSIGAMSNELSGRFGQAYKVAERLIRTETNHIHSEADRAAYEEAEVEEYEYMATLDARTCAVCGALDGKIFKVKDAKTGVNYPPMHPNDRCTTIEHRPDDAEDWQKSGEPMPKSTTYKEWYDLQTAKNGQGSVDIERSKWYNRSADYEQYHAYSERLGVDAPSSFADFQNIKYGKPDEWAETKSFYSYKSRVPEATKKDFGVYKIIKDNGFTGVIRVPPSKIETSGLSIDSAHITARGHNVTLEEAKGYIKNALFSVKRNMSTNYYSPEGAAYAGHDGIIKTAFKRHEYTGKIKKIMEILGYGN